MEPTIIYSERSEKLNALLRAFLYRSQVGIVVEELDTMLFHLDTGEADQLCQQLLNDGAICYAVGQFGLVLTLTEKGIEWILSGGYAVQEPSHRSTSPKQYKINTRTSDKILRYLLLAVFCISLLACFFPCR